MADGLPWPCGRNVSGVGTRAVAVEMNAEGDIYPAVYVEREGEVSEHLLPPNHLNDFEGEEYVRELASLFWHPAQRLRNRRRRHAPNSADFSSYSCRASPAE